MVLSVVSTKPSETCWFLAMTSPFNGCSVDAPARASSPSARMA
jgi:hypothetical protein